MGRPFKPESRNWRTNRKWARAIMERHLGRKLLTSEHVHHINRDFTDNRIENLAVLSNSEHARLHGRERLNNSPEAIAKREEYKRTRPEYKRQWARNNPDKIAATYARVKVTRRQIPHMCRRCQIPFLGLKHSQFCSHSCSRLMALGK